MYFYGYLLYFYAVIPAVLILWMKKSQTTQIDHFTSIFKDS